MAQNTDDPRTEQFKIDMAAGWEEHADEYRDDENYGGSEVVYEDDQLVIVADHTGHELNEYLNDHEVPRRVVSSWMHDVAREKTDYDWGSSDPIVFDKPESASVTGPSEDAAAERELIREQFSGTDIHTLLYHGSEEWVAVVQRDKAPSTENPMRGERIVVVQWFGDEWALSTATGEGVGTKWELEEEVAAVVDTRDALPEAVADLFEGDA